MNKEQIETKLNERLSMNYRQDLYTTTLAIYYLAKVIEEKLNNADKLNEYPPDETTGNGLPFKIVSVFRPADRLDELDKIPTIDGYTDYWTAAKLLCEKDGGHLATREELAQIASEIYENEDGTPVTIAEDEDGWDLKVKDKYKDNPLIPLGYFYWSSEEYTADDAYHRGFDTACTDGSGNGWSYKCYSYYRAVCIGN